MAVKTEQVEKNLVKLTFEVSAEEFNKAVNKSYKKQIGRINVPGFRKGKAPRAIVEKIYGEAVFYNDAIDEVLQPAYEAALKESGADSVARPEIDVEEIKKGEPVVFTALVTTRPEVTLGEYKGIEIDKIDYTVSEEDVDNDIAATQRQNARMISVDDRAVQDGDIATIDYEGFVDGVAFDGGKDENYDLEIGSGSFIPGFEDALIGAEIGVETDVNVTFPEEYHAENLAGKPAVFKVTVKEIKVRELPELDDDFASEVSEFETMTEYRADVRAKLEKTAEEKAKTETENAVVDKVVANAEVDIPDVMVDMQVENNINEFAQRLQYQGLNIDDYFKYSGTTMDALKETYKPQALQQVKGSLVLEAVRKAEGIETGPEELEMNLIDMAKKYGMETDKLKEILGESEINNISLNMALNKTVQMLVNNAVVK